MNPLRPVFCFSLRRQLRFKDFVLVFLSCLMFFSQNYVFFSVFAFIRKRVVISLRSSWEFQVIQMCFDSSSQPKNVLCFSLYMFYFLLSVNQKCALFSRLACSFFPYFLWLGNNVAFFTSQPKMCFVSSGMFFFFLFFCDY